MKQASGRARHEVALIDVARLESGGPVAERGVVLPVLADAPTTEVLAARATILTHYYDYDYYYYCIRITITITILTHLRQ